MKKFLLYAVTAFTIMLFVGCGKTETGEKSLYEISAVTDFALSVEKTSPTGIEIKVLNNSPETLCWGSWYALEKKEDSGWYEVLPTKLEDGAVIGWTSELFFLDSNETRNIEMQWYNACGELSKGDYRIVKDFFFDERDQDDKIYTACEFHIE